MVKLTTRKIIGQKDKYIITDIFEERLTLTKTFVVQSRNTIIYWIATVLLSFGMLASGLQQVMQTQPMLDLIKPLGYPPYFLFILGTWKILGVIAILLPGFKIVKEWAYAGFFFAMTGALASHIAVGDTGFKAVAGPVTQTIFIVISWYLRPANRKIKVN